MGQCGCGNGGPHDVYRVGRDKFLGIKPYFGCDYCDTGIGFDLTFLNSAGRKDWADGIPIQPRTFDEYGADAESALMLGIVGKRELLRAAKRLIDEDRMGADFEDFGTVEDWLDEYGLLLLQEAFRIHLEEILKTAQIAHPTPR